MLAEADIIIVAVPTPVDEAHIPDFRPLIGASTSVGRAHEEGRHRRLRIHVYPARPRRSASPCWNANPA
jgi:UDP-N-acetyl-D-galactosamine dehydrogenase